MNEEKTETQTASHTTGGVHVMPFKVLVRVWGSLLALTVITALVAGIDLGSLNLPIALAIAILKASLVLLFFMHMRYDRPINAIAFIAALLFFMLFVTLALLDSHAYAPELNPGYAPALGK